ncbi:MAG: hypothetical protein ABSE48_16315 [Verrucomicrobiota bacterium]|jgi:hypothetical protein
MSDLLLLTSTQLKRAADIKDKISALELELSAILGASPVAAAPQKKSTMSASARAKIAAAQRARWARVKGKKPSTKPAAKASAKKKGMSASAKARLSALAKARWAKVKAAGRKAL